MQKYILAAGGFILALSVFFFLYFYLWGPITIRNNTGQDIRRIEFKGTEFSFNVENLRDKTEDTFRKRLGTNFDFDIKIHFEDDKILNQSCRGNSTREYNKIVFEFNPNGILKISTSHSKVKEFWEYIL